MGSSCSSPLSCCRKEAKLTQAFLSLVHQVNTSVIGTTTQSKQVQVNPDHLVVDPCGLFFVADTRGAGGVSHSIYKESSEVWGTIHRFTEEARKTLKKTGDGHYSSYNGRPLLHIVSPNFANRRSTRFGASDVIRELTAAYTKVLTIALDPECKEHHIDCVPFSWGVNAGIWRKELPLLTLFALSEAFGSLSRKQRKRFGPCGDKRFNLCLYRPQEQTAMAKVLTMTKMSLA